MNKTKLQRKLEAEGFTFRKINNVFEVKNSDGRSVGSLSVKEIGKDQLSVGAIDVDAPYRQKKLGTALYELAVAHACTQGKQVISSDLRSPFSEAFWIKQQKKNRAECVDTSSPGGDVHFTPLYSLDSDTLDRMLPFLPDPERNAKVEPYWPCRIWGLKREHCGAISLEGVTSDAFEKQGYRFFTTETPGGSILLEAKEPSKNVTVGTITLRKDGTKRYEISDIRAAKSIAHKKLGTALYEKASSFACAKNATLVSDMMRSHYAEAFWQKQERKGRASCEAINTHREPINAKPVADQLLEAKRACEDKHGFQNQKAVQFCLKQKRETLLARLPQPKTDGRVIYWPCLQYKLDSCPRDLGGLPRRRRR